MFFVSLKQLMIEIAHSDWRTVVSVVGVSHRTMPVELRERLAFGGAELPDVLRTLGHGVILSTCNRTEIYYATDRHDVEVSIKHLLASRLTRGAAELTSHWYVLHGDDAVRHLFAVTCGLESLVLGDSQILGQARRALDLAKEVGTTCPILVHAFRGAFRAGKRARAETFIGRHAVSVSYAAVELARQTLGRLAGRRVLVVGAGEMAEATARTLVENGVGAISFVNRTLSHAESLAARFNGRALSFDDLVPALREADIVISSTNAPHYVVSPSSVAAALGERGDRPLFLIDIAVPRDIDPDCRTFPNVHLYDIDDLRGRCDHSREARQSEVEAVRSIIDEEVAGFGNWSRTRAAVPAICALRDGAEQIRQGELAEAVTALRHLDAKDLETVDALTRAIVNKLLHQPTIRLRAASIDPRLGRVG